MGQNHVILNQNGTYTDQRAELKSFVACQIITQGHQPLQKQQTDSRSLTCNGCHFFLNKTLKTFKFRALRKGVGNLCQKLIQFIVPSKSKRLCAKISSLGQGMFSALSKQITPAICNTFLEACDNSLPFESEMKYSCFDCKSMSSKFTSSLYRALESVHVTKSTKNNACVFFELVFGSDSYGKAICNIFRSELAPKFILSFVQNLIKQFHSID